MGEWPKLISIAFELLFASVVIGLIAFLFSIAHSAGDREQDRINASEDMQIYREYNRWDNGNAVYYQDIVELILTHQKSMAFEIDRFNASTVRYTTNMYTPSISEYTRDAMHQTFHQDNVLHYKATLIRDTSDPGLILGYSFEASNQPPD